MSEMYKNSSPKRNYSIIFLEKAVLCSSKYPRTCYVEQSDFKLLEPPKVCLLSTRYAPPGQEQRVLTGTSICIEPTYQLQDKLIIWASILTHGT